MVGDSTLHYGIRADIFKKKAIRKCSTLKIDFDDVNFCAPIAADCPTEAEKLVTLTKTDQR